MRRAHGLARALLHAPRRASSIPLDGGSVSCGSEDSRSERLPFSCFRAGPRVASKPGRRRLRRGSVDPTLTYESAERAPAHLRERHGVHEAAAPSLTAVHLREVGGDSPSTCPRLKRAPGGRGRASESLAARPALGPFVRPRADGRAGVPADVYRGISGWHARAERRRAWRPRESPYGRSRGADDAFILSGGSYRDPARTAAAFPVTALIRSSSRS